MTAFDLSFVLEQGTFRVEVAAQVEASAVALVGPSGSGKTSILEVVAGLRRPRRGRIAVAGHVLFDAAGGVDLPPRQRHVGYVPQDVLLFPHLDVARNLAYGRQRGRGVDTAAIVELLELAPLMDRRVHTLSGGEKQRVALARALQSGPDVLLLDEPLAAVDVPRRRRILEALLVIRDQLQVPIVYVTHASEEAMTIADHVLVLNEGAVVAAGSPREVLVQDGSGPAPVRDSPM